ncbi:MAG: class I SAM-dependent methyltransferase [Balneola sp.]|nr:MAG: class I SAM-dependent methyltransferase [Balneola sp.]
MNTASTEIFARNWRIYQEILEQNYMFHHNLSQKIFRFLRKHRFSSPFNVLDAGCGDAYMLSNLLKNISVNSFTGYDMSSQALSIAKENLHALKTEVKLVQGPMESSIKKEDTTFGLIYSSFAIHHLDDHGKKELLRGFYNHLREGGIFIAIDIMRDQKLSREEYLEEYIEHIATKWTMISDSDKELIYNHMRNFDFPAINDNFLEWLKEAGFNLVHRFDPDSRNVMLIAQK